MDIQRKSFTGIELKKDKPGEFTARIATLKVVDKDGDYTLPGAAPVGKKILISAYQHGSWMGELPVGAGVVKEADDAILVDGIFNLNTATGKEHYETVKFAPELQEWSYGYKVLDADNDVEMEGIGNVWRVIKKMDIFEASPVLRGAGIDTATLNIKSDKELTFAEQSEAALATVKEWAARTKALAALRQKEGRDLSETNRARITKALDDLNVLALEMKALLIKPGPPDNSQAKALYLAFLKKESEIKGVFN